MAVFTMFSTFFGAFFFVMTRIYGQTKYILQKNCPHISFPCCREAPNILHPLLKRPHRLLNWQIQVTRVSWVGQSTMFQVKGRVESLQCSGVDGGLICNTFHGSYIPLWQRYSPWNVQQALKCMEMNKSPNGFAPVQPPWNITCTCVCSGYNADKGKVPKVEFLF